MRKDIWKNAFNQAMSELSEEDLADTSQLMSDKHISEAKLSNPFMSKIIPWVATAAVLTILIGLVLMDPLSPQGPDISLLENAGSETLSADHPGDGTLVSEQTLSPDDGNPTPAQSYSPSYDAAQLTLVRAEYPEQLRYTADIVSQHDPDFDSQKSQERRLKREMAQVSTGKLDSFYQKSLQAFLADSTDENTFYSPAGLFLSLSLLAESAEGSSRTEILQALGSETMEELRALSSAFWLSQYNDDGVSTCRFANSLWLNSFWLGSASEQAAIPGLYQVRDDALQRIKDSYFASVFQGDMNSPEYNAFFRDWCQEEAGLLFPTAEIGPALDPLSLLEIASTVNFNARWMWPFNPKKTIDGIFHGTREETTVSYMRASFDSLYYYGDHFGAIDLPLSGSNTLWLILPDEGVDARSLAAEDEVFSLLKTNGTPSAEWSEKNALAMIHLSLPKFTVSSERDLIPTLAQMGIEEVFTEGEADLTGLIETEEPAYVSSATSTLRLQIDEEGVKATSLIALNYAGARKPDQDVDFVLDRPFLYAITSWTDDLLFAGVVEQIGE